MLTASFTGRYCTRCTVQVSCRVYISYQIESRSNMKKNEESATRGVAEEARIRVLGANVPPRDARIVLQTRNEFTPACQAPSLTPIDEGWWSVIRPLEACAMNRPAARRGLIENDTPRPCQKFQYKSNVFIGNVDFVLKNEQNCAIMEGPLRFYGPSTGHGSHVDAVPIPRTSVERCPCTYAKC